MVTVDGYCLSLAVIKTQIARLPQTCKTGHSATLPLQLLRLFVCWVLIGDEFCSAGIHAVFGSNSLSGSHQLSICLATLCCKFVICEVERHTLLWERY